MGSATHQNDTKLTRAPLACFAVPPIMPAQMACSPVRSTMMVSSCSSPRNLATSSTSSPLVNSQSTRDWEWGSRSSTASSSHRAGTASRDALAASCAPEACPAPKAAPTRTQAAMPPARKGMESTVYRSEATVMEATERSGCGSSAASRMVTPALHASSTFIAQDAYASRANLRHPFRAAVEGRPHVRACSPLLSTNTSVRMKLMQEEIVVASAAPDSPNSIPKMSS
mmetsp:Transcript_20345/g.61294  ORF Transcript_20345/g.61294 Transcript_20345/m.61294 type:complete len:227 (+) Transcript_20345:603-1283(+)